jgi:AraC-like DNA-binding protein
MKETFFKYPSEDENKWGLNIITCGYNHYHTGKNYPQTGHPESHDFTWEKGRKINGFHLVYIPTGSGYFETEQQTYEIHSGDAIFIYDNDWHRYRPNERTGWEEYWVGFDGNYLRNYIIPELFPNRVSYLKKTGYQEDIILLFDHFLTLSAKDSPLFRKMLVGCLLELLAYFGGASEKKSQTNRNAFIVERTIDTIRNNIADDVDFHQMATMFHISYSHFRKIFKEATGSPPNQFLISERIACAKRLLTNTELNISEIARKSGFHTIHYFSKLFKQKTGKSPSSERNN